ncbi:MAG: hypothetical protein J0H98_09390 [Solirubrobacterales bacterium]|nr:hypothetical protein [Solirubrobacterales bacterium]
MTGASTTVKPEVPKAGTGQRVAIVAFAAILVGVAVWGLTACNRDGDPSSAAVGADPTDARVVAADELAALPDEVGHQVFWAGERSDTQIEFSHDGSGNTHLRYLTDGAEPGTPEQSFLNIGTYPFTGAYEATRNLASRKGLVRITANGGVGFYDPANPYSVIIAWPEQPDLQVEVYDPEKNAALDVVRSGDIVPVS